MQLRVPKRPYPKGHLFAKAEKHLAFKHVKMVDYADPKPSASIGDSLALQVLHLTSQIFPALAHYLLQNRT